MLGEVENAHTIADGLEFALHTLVVRTLTAHTRVAIAIAIANRDPSRLLGDATLSRIWSAEFDPDWTGHLVTPIIPLLKSRDADSLLI